MDRQYLDRLVEFVKEWERKNEKKQLRDFIEYLGYFDELDGDVQIEEELSEDAVQLMTVHAAKGLEFPHVFILRLSKSDFPSGARRPEFEFPPELMKEEQPKEDFHIQEERRLFYVALTRAQKRLTLSTIVNRRKKPSPFLDDFLMNAKIQKADVAQSAPKVDVPPSEEIAGPAPAAPDPTQLFPAGPESARAYSRVALWAKAFHPPRPEPLQLSASAIDAYDRCPMKYMFQYVWNIRGGPHAQMTFGNVMHATIREFVSRGAQAWPRADRGSDRDLRARNGLRRDSRTSIRKGNTARRDATSWKHSIAALRPRRRTCCIRKKVSSFRWSTTWSSPAAWIR